MNSKELETNIREWLGKNETDGLWTNSLSKKLYGRPIDSDIYAYKPVDPNAYTYKPTTTIDWTSVRPDGKMFVTPGKKNPEEPCIEGTVGYWKYKLSIENLLSNRDEALQLAVKILDLLEENDI